MSRMSELVVFSVRELERFRMTSDVRAPFTIHCFYWYLTLKCVSSLYFPSISSPLRPLAHVDGEILGWKAGPLKIKEN